MQHDENKLAHTHTSTKKIFKLQTGKWKKFDKINTKSVTAQSRDACEIDWPADTLHIWHMLLLRLLLSHHTPLHCTAQRVSLNCANRERTTIAEWICQLFGFYSDFYGTYINTESNWKRLALSRYKLNERRSEWEKRIKCWEIQELSG